MTIDKLQSGYKKIEENFAKIMKINYFTQSYDDVYDNQEYLTLSGAVWISGIVLPIQKLNGTSDYVLQQQGRLQDNDLKLFVSGNINLGGSLSPMRIQMGSPTANTDSYSVVDTGIHNWESQGTSIFKKAIIRKIQGGSLIGEIGDEC